ncbi:Terpene synthase, metal-binding domain-containing protein [Cynara cardunculus var. scolymus]|uniref:Terpene synthase, metal-binding domain-containing protein n=1 Tax=Cynara cardunculus var. scolymus TaxID=59895 RepID=A0A103T1T0_CYNCS|nr:Terpene synthase, metal-binding domain-containing protein [Cynara cardunculus var. scolymus]
MGKLDYNNCVAIHQLEWNTMQQWYVDFDMGRFGMSNTTSLLVSYYLAAASVFEPERSIDRIAWAKTTTLLNAISSFFDSLQLSIEHRKDFVDKFRNKPSSLRTLHELALDTLMACGRDIHPQIPHACRKLWERWLTRWQGGGDATEEQAELMVQTISMIDGRWTSKELLAHPQYQRISTVTNNLCHEISQSHKSKENRITCFDSETANATIECRMQELVQHVLSRSPDDLDRDLRQTFLAVAKTFFYKAYYDTDTINVHITKVLFETVL